MLYNQAADNNMITAKEIMREFEVSYQIVNHYTNFGLLPVVIKKANIRYYDRDTVKGRLKKIRELMQQGYSLSLIRKKLVEEIDVENFTNSSENIAKRNPQITK
ncbi:MAG: helix-turn-helix domain-containing protein [Candidatus Omnitrophica bacterium]|nr:helix-turn-helix domain-containing protein [Candidatus Omnitrophota bacterium]